MSSKAKEVQQEVDQVIEIMHDNIDKVVQRGEKLENLQSKTDDLQQGALQFKRGATKVRRQMWWKDLKFKIMIGIIFVVILLCIIVPIATSSKSPNVNVQNLTNQKLVSEPESNGVAPPAPAPTELVENSN